MGLGTPITKDENEDAGDPFEFMDLPKEYQPIVSGLLTAYDGLPEEYKKPAPIPRHAPDWLRARVDPTYEPLPLSDEGWDWFIGEVNELIESQKIPGKYVLALIDAFLDQLQAKTSRGGLSSINRNLPEDPGIVNPKKPPL